MMTTPWHLTAAEMDAAWDDLAAENAALRARLTSVERERDEIMAMAERREGELQARLAEVERANAELNVEVSRLYACRNELQDVTQAMDDPSVNNSRDLENAIHDMKARLAEAEALRKRRRDEVVSAYIQGANDVHANWREDKAPDFTEAAMDYALSIDAAQETARP